MHETPHTEQANELLSQQPLTEPLVQAAGTAARNPHSISYKHIDDFLDDTIALIDYPHLKYPHFLFSHWRKSAVEKNAHYPFMRQFKLFADYEGETWRVIGASSLGDVWLTKNFNAENGYDRRVDPDFTKFTNWRDHADRTLSWEERVLIGVNFYQMPINISEGAIPKICNKHTSFLQRAGAPKQYMDCTAEQRRFLESVGKQGLL
jgi:hypothetical protein